jgi:hypothetical protein
MGFPSVVFGFIIVVAVVIGVIGVLMIFRGFAALGRSRQLADSGQQTTATIVDTQMTSHRATGNQQMGTYSSSYMTFKPVVQYRTQMGQVVTAVGPTSTRTSFVKGTTVPIRYNPDDPSQIELLSGMGRGSGGVARIAVGIFFVVFVIGFIFFALSIRQ